MLQGFFRLQASHFITLPLWGNLCRPGPNLNRHLPGYSGIWGSWKGDLPLRWEWEGGETTGPY